VHEACNAACRKAAQTRKQGPSGQDLGSLLQEVCPSKDQVVPKALDIETVLKCPEDHSLVVTFAEGLLQSSPRLSNRDYSGMLNAPGGFGKTRCESMWAVGEVYREVRNLLQHSDRVVRARAARALRSLCIEAGAAAATFLKEDSSSEMRKSAARTLSIMEEGSAQHHTRSLEACLFDEDITVRRLVVAALVHSRADSIRCNGMGEGCSQTLAEISNAKDLSTVVIDQLSRNDGLDGTDALVKLARTGFLKPGELASLCGDSDSDVRCEAASALGNMGARANAHLEKLSAVLRDKVPRCRICATVALQKFGGAAVAQVEALLEDPDFVVRRTAVGALTSMTIAASGVAGSAAARQATDFSFQLVNTAHLETEGAGVAASLVGTGYVRSNGLVTLLRDPNAELRCAATEAVALLGPAAAKYERRLHPLLKEADVSSRKAASKALRDLGCVVPSSAVLDEEVATDFLEEDMDGGPQRAGESTQHSAKQVGFQFRPKKHDRFEALMPKGKGGGAGTQKSVQITLPSARCDGGYRQARPKTADEEEEMNQARPRFKHSVRYDSNRNLLTAQLARLAEPSRRRGSFSVGGDLFTYHEHEKS